MNNYHLLKAIYLPYTKTKPARIKIYSHRFNQSIFISRGEGDVWYNDAVQHLQSLGFEMIGYAESKDGMGLISNTFKELK